MMCNKWSVILVILIFLEYLLAADCNEGYIMYCPCMGRFGNQAEQLLGSLLFAKSLNRTLILPPFINYGLNITPTLVPFNQVIQYDPLKDYHSVVLMEDYINMANKTEPGKQQFYCYAPRDDTANKISCGALRGQPFNKFWSSFNITEDDSIFYKPLTANPNEAAYWEQLYPITSNRVLSFVGAPSPFPTHKEAIGIQKHIKLSPEVESQALEFRKQKGFQDKPYLSMHIRHGTDWKRACELLRSDSSGLTRLFSSNQCTGYKSNTNLQYETCFPSFESIANKLDQTLTELLEKKMMDIKTVHIATDNHESELWTYLRERFPQVNFHLNPTDPDEMIGTMTDIYLMAYSDAFIGNCISSFSAFPARIRTEQLGLKDMTYYFGQSFSTDNRLPPSREDL